jgi:hypothetical protein
MMRNLRESIALKNSKYTSSEDKHPEAPLEPKKVSSDL